MGWCTHCLEAFLFTRDAPGAHRLNHLNIDGNPELNSVSQQLPWFYIGKIPIIKTKESILFYDLSCICLCLHCSRARASLFHLRFIWASCSSDTQRSRSP